MADAFRSGDTAAKAKEIAGCIRRGLSRAIGAGLRSASHHPFILSVVLFLLVLYRCFPCVFSLLASSFPVFICTTILLGIILSYGNPNLNPEVEGDKKVHDANLRRAGRAAATDLVVRRDESSAIAVEGAIKEIHNDKGEVDVGVEKRKLSVEKKEAKGKKSEQPKELKVESGASDSRFDSSLGSPWQPVDRHDASTDYASDSAESSSPDASITDVIPIIDELHPLLDTKAPQLALKSGDNSDAGSDGSCQGSDEEEEHHEEEEEDEAQEEKDDGNEEVVKWTADDQKNLMDLGTSEMERNQRLENLIARRSMRKSVIPEIQGNLIDLDVTDPAPTMDELSRIQAQIPLISATRRNPFDGPYDSEQTVGLPPIPGSAPSMIHPRHNPFDLPYDQANQSNNSTVEGLSHQVFVPVPQRDPFFRRHESFTLGASFPGEFGREKRDGRLKPYFIPERLEETGFPPLQRQLSENSNSSVSTTPESDTASSVIEQADQKDLLEEGVHQDGELLSPADHDAEPVEEESESSEETERSHTDIGAAREISLNASMVTEGTHQVTEDLAEEYNLTIPGADKLEVIEDNYDESNSSSSSEGNEDNAKHESSANLEAVRDKPSKVSGDSNIPVPVDTEILSRAGETADEIQVADPVYDSSPSAAEKALDIGSFHEGETDSNSSSSLSSGTEDNLSENGSPFGPIANTIFSGGDPEDLAFSSGGLWVASPSLSSVDEIESRSREVNEIKELDVIQVGFPGAHEDYAKPIKLVMQRSITSRMMPPSALSSMEAESSEDAH